MEYSFLSYALPFMDHYLVMAKGLVYLNEAMAYAL